MNQKKIREMRALSVIQPWATCIIHHGKNVENRKQITHLRGTIAIHASKKKEFERFAWLEEDYRIILDCDSLPYGAIIGFADIVDVITRKTVTSQTKKWFAGKYGYVLQNIVILKKPIPAKGALGFWRLKGAALNKCLKQVPAIKQKRFRPLMKPE
jgi:hypothetical protein